MNSGDRKPGETEDAALPEGGVGQTPPDAASGSAEAEGAATPGETSEARPWGAHGRAVEDAEEVSDGAESAARMAATETGALSDDARSPEPAPAEEAAPEPARETRPEPAPAPKQGSSFAAKALTALILLIAGAAAALWAGPKLAPMLPAPIADFMAPAGAGVSPEALAAVEGGISDRLSALDARVAEAAAAAEAPAALPQQAADRIAALEQAVAALESRPEPEAAADPALAARIAEIEAAIVALGSAPTQAGAQGGGDAAVAGMREAVASLEKAVSGAAAKADAASAEAAALSARVEALSETVASLGDAQAQADSAIADAAAAEAAAEAARRAASASAALATIDRAMTLGQPFGDALAIARRTVDAPPPAALEDAATSGAPTRESLKASFPDAAYRGIRGALAAESSSDNPLSGFAAALQARVTGLPEEAVPGDSAQAKLSRARVALLSGDLDGAIAIIEALPPEAQEAMADWTDGARLRAGADDALASWRAEIGRAE